jgi:hypothetical protein
MPGSRSTNSRSGTWFAVVEVVAERQTSKRTVSRGLPYESKVNETTYRLECGHEVTRERKRCAPRAVVGRQLRCDTCWRLKHASP